MFIRLRLFTVAVAVISSVFACALAGEVPEPVMLEPYAHPKGYVCYRAPSPVTIDGKLDDAAWAAAPWTDDFVDIEGDKRPRPRFRTRAKMLWDDEALYIAAELEEPHVWATLKEHDSIIFSDNDFEMFISPTGDNQMYGELELNALNTTWDLLLTRPYKDRGRAIHAWEIIGLKTAVHVDGTLNNPGDTDKGWTVEVKWPWAGLKELMDKQMAPPKNGEKWRVNFSRVEWDLEVVDGRYRKFPKRPEHNWVWSPQGVIDMHRPERWGYLQFSTAKAGTDSFQPDPDWAVRDLLHRAYYAQKGYYKAHKKYAATVGELGFKDAAKLTLETTHSGFEISTTVPAEKDMTSRRFAINQDARIWVE